MSQKYKCKYCGRLTSRKTMCFPCKEKLVLVWKLLKMVKAKAGKE